MLWLSRNRQIILSIIEEQQLELEITYGWSTQLHPYPGVRSFELGN